MHKEYHVAVESEVSVRCRRVDLEVTQECDIETIVPTTKGRTNSTDTGSKTKILSISAVISFSIVSYGKRLARNVQLLVREGLLWNEEKTVVTTNNQDGAPQTPQIHRELWKRYTHSGRLVSSKFYDIVALFKDE